MSEALPKNLESSGEEIKVDLEALRQGGAEKAKAAIAELGNLEDMEYRERYGALLELLKSFDNQEDRFAAKYVANELAKEELKWDIYGKNQEIEELEKMREFYS